MYIADWLTGKIFLPHKKIKAGKIVSIDYDNDGNPVMEWAKEKRVVFEGTFESKFTLCSSDGGKLIYEEFEQHIIEHGLEKGFEPFLEFSGNAVKFLQGHNVYGHCDIYSLVYESVARCLTELKLHHLLLPLRGAIYSDNWRVTRIDITTMLQLETDEQVSEYMKTLKYQSHIRSGDIQTTKNTLYFGKGSSLWAVKAYNKYLELCSRSKKHQLPKQLRFSGLKEFCIAQLRLELTLRKTQLDRLEMTHPKKLKENIEKLYLEFIGKIEMNTQVEIESLQSLPRSLLSTYMLWKEGKHMKSILTEPTYYRHKKGLLAYGINIAIPPKDKKSTVKIVSLTKTLVPKKVTYDDIPANLQQYIHQPVSHLRVA